MRKDRFRCRKAGILLVAAVGSDAGTDEAVAALRRLHDAAADMPTFLQTLWKYDNYGDIPQHVCVCVLCVWKRRPHCIRRVCVSVCVC